MSTMEQFYEVLKLKLGATEKQIKQAYENLVNMWHPITVCSPIWR